MHHHAISETKYESIVRRPELSRSWQAVVYTYSKAIDLNCDVHIHPYSKDKSHKIIQLWHQNSLLRGKTCPYHSLAQSLSAVEIMRLTAPFSQLTLTGHCTYYLTTTLYGVCLGRNEWEPIIRRLH